MGYVLMHLAWSALATIPAAVSAVLFTRCCTASAALKTWVCRAAIVASILVLLAVGVGVQASLRHERPSGDLSWLGTAASSLVAAAWLSGAGLRVVRLIRAGRLVRELRLNSSALPHAVAERLTPGLSRNAALRASDFVDTVVVLYGPKPMILVPPKHFADPDLPVAVSHEMAHLDNGDGTWNLAFELLAIALWFSPAILHLGDRLRVCQELAADASAIKSQGCSSARYGRMLLRFSNSEVAAVPFMAALGAEADMEERLKALRPPGRWTRVFGVLAAVAALSMMIPLRPSDGPSPLAHLHRTIHARHG